MRCDSGRRRCGSRSVIKPARWYATAAAWASELAVMVIQPSCVEPGTVFHIEDAHGAGGPSGGSKVAAPRCSLSTRRPWSCMGFRAVPSPVRLRLNSAAHIAPAVISPTT